MKTLISETGSETIQRVESPERPHDSPQAGLVLLERASKIAERPGEVGASAAAGVSDQAGLTTILAGGLPRVQRTWKSYATSISLHAIIVALMLAITVPVIEEVRRPTERIVYIPPALKPYRPKLVSPRHIEPPKLVIKKLIEPPQVKPPEVKPQRVTPAPVIKQMAPIASAQPAPKIEAPAPPAPPAPKPQIRTGVFETADLAKSAEKLKQVKTGGFGDPNGVPPSAQPSSSSLTMAKLGSFDLPAGEAKGGSTGRAVVQGGFGGAIGGGGTSGSGHNKGSVRAGGFGDASGTGAGSGGGNGHAGAVRNGGFGDAAAVQAPGSTQRAAPARPASTPAEILFKPKPIYTAEARNLKVEGQVALQVVFQASGTVRVLRVVHGLGHGLDEAAEQAAEQVRFRPATQGGVPVDTTATIYITFELT